MTDAQEHELLAVAQEAAQAGGAELRSRFGRPQDGVRTKTTPTDPVSDADLSAEGAVRSVLEARRPDDAILAEEGGASGGDGALRWIVDPLDGTVNFLFGVPVFCVSIACEDADGVVAGVVLDPVREECFAATRSGAPTLNGLPFAAPARAAMSEALVATGFGYDSELRARQAEALARVLPAVRDIRRLGSAALDLCWTAIGRYDAYFERGLKRWDLAAGGLIASRAGLEVRPVPEGGPTLPAGLLAAPGAYADELLRLVVGEG